jgi:hypothetical protein
VELDVDDVVLEVVDDVDDVVEDVVVDVLELVVDVEEVVVDVDVVDEELVEVVVVPLGVGSPAWLTTKGRPAITSVAVRGCPGFGAMVRFIDAGPDPAVGWTVIQLTKF